MARPPGGAAGSHLQHARWYWLFWSLRGDHRQSQAWGADLSLFAQRQVIRRWQRLLKLRRLYGIRCAWLESNHQHPQFDARFAATQQLQRRYGLYADLMALWLGVPGNQLRALLEASQ